MSGRPATLGEAWLHSSIHFLSHRKSLQIPVQFETSRMPVLRTGYNFLHQEGQLLQFCGSKERLHRTCWELFPAEQVALCAIALRTSWLHVSYTTSCQVEGQPKYAYPAYSGFREVRHPAAASKDDTDGNCPASECRRSSRSAAPQHSSPLSMSKQAASLTVTHILKEAKPSTLWERDASIARPGVVHGHAIPQSQITIP